MSKPIYNFRKFPWKQWILFHSINLFPVSTNGTDLVL